MLLQVLPRIGKCWGTQSFQGNFWKSKLLGILSIESTISGPNTLSQNLSIHIAWLQRFSKTVRDVRWNCDFLNDDISMAIDSIGDIHSFQMQVINYISDRKRSRISSEGRSFFIFATVWIRIITRLFTISCLNAIIMRSISLR